MTLDKHGNYTKDRLDHGTPPKWLPMLELQPTVLPNEVNKQNVGLFYFTFINNQNYNKQESIKTRISSF